MEKLLSKFKNRIFRSIRIERVRESCIFMKKCLFTAVIILIILVSGVLVFKNGKQVTLDPRSQLAQVGSAATPAFVQGKTNKVWNGSTVSISFDSPVTAGNLIAFSTKWESSSVTLISVSASCTNGNFTLVDHPIVYSSTRVVAQGYVV